MVDRTGTGMQVPEEAIQGGWAVEADIQYSDFGMFDSISFPE
jgi:hypothetical protein